MLNKPFELTGEALPFVEWCNSQFMEIWVNWRIPFLDVKSFYSQTFTLDMFVNNEMFNVVEKATNIFNIARLPEYFRNVGIKQKEYIRYKYYVGDNSGYIVFEKTEMRIYDNYNQLAFLFPFPKTINSFLTYCFDAGMKLTWKNGQVNL